MPRAKQSPGKRPTPTNAETAERQRKALEMRVAGATFEQIAAQVGYADASGAYRAVSRGLLETQRPAADELRALMVRRYERLLLGVWRDAVGGNLKAADVARKILTDMARITLPLKVEATVTQQTETDAAIADLVAELERRGQPTPTGE